MNAPDTEWPPTLTVSRNLLDTLAPPPPLPPVAFDRVEGMLLGLAIGDALGNTSEGTNPGQRRKRHGEIRDYLPNRHAGDRPVGLPSDDTQLAFRTLRHLLDFGRIVPERLVDTLADGRIFGIGHTMLAFLEERRAGKPWPSAAQHSAGNGALMRIAPVVLPHLATPSTALWRDAALAGAVTHDDATSISACVAFAGMLYELLGTDAAPESVWWIDRYVERARPLEGKRHLRSRRPGACFTGSCWELVDTEVREALARGEGVLTACDRWYSGAFLLETVPSALYILARHAHDVEESIVRAVNDTRDNDTVAAIVGAAAGALHGRAALPDRWIRNLAGRLGAHDDGHLFELVERSREAWFQTPT